MNYTVTCEHAHAFGTTEYPVAEASDYHTAVTEMAAHACRTYPRFELTLNWRDPLKDEGTYIYDGPLPDDDGSVTYTIRQSVTLTEGELDAIRIPAAIAVLS